MSDHSREILSGTDSSFSPVLISKLRKAGNARGNVPYECGALGGDHDHRIATALCAYRDCETPEPNGVISAVVRS
jgi:hypothetical protein